MTILTRNTILLALAGFDGKVEGKTMLQKLLYFLGELLKQRFQDDPGFQHNAYYYGPYSSIIASDMTKLVNYRLVREDVHNFGSYNTAGFEVRKSEFTLTPAADAALQWIEKQHPEDSERVKAVVTVLNEVAKGLDQADLSIAAKAHWILKQTKEPMTPESVAREAEKLSWNVTWAQIGRGFEFLKKLGLLEEVAAGNK